MRFLRTQAGRYLAALLAVAAALLLRWAIERAVGALPAFITYYPAVILAALLGGLGPGLAASFLASLVAAYATLPPAGFAIARTADIIALAFFFVVCVGLSVVAELYRRYRERASTLRTEVAEKEGDERFRALFENMTEGVAVHEVVYDHDVPVDYRILEVNPAFERHTGVGAELAAGKLATELYGTDEAPYLAEYARVAETGEPFSFEVYFAPMERHFNIAATSPRRGIFATIFSDVTERKGAEDILRRYELLAGHSRDIMLFVDRDDWRILEANEAAVRAYGYSREELLSMTIGHLRARSTQQEISHQMAEAEDGGILFQTEHRRKDGSVFPVEVSSRGAVIGEQRTLVSVVRDITERKRAEEALHESEQRLRFHLENTPMAVIEWDADFIVTRWAGEAERVFGWSEGETLGVPIADLNTIYEEDIPIVEQTMAQLTDGVTRHVVSSNRNYTKDGRVIECTWYNSVLLDPEGKMASVMSLVLDETERKRAEEALRTVTERERFLADVVETADVAFGVGAPDGRLLLFNQAFADLTGYSRQELEADELTWLDLTPPEWQEREAAWLTAALQTRQAVRYEKEYVRKDGSRVPIELFVQPQFDEHGVLQNYRSFLADISARKASEAALQESRTRAEVLARTTSALLSSDDPQRQVEDLCREVMERLDCQAFFNFLADDTLGRLHLNAYAGIPDEEARRIEWLDYGVAVCGCAARDASRIVAEDIQSTPDVRTELVRSYGIKAYACHPLMAQDRVLGTLSFGTSTRTRFAEDELALMKAVADHVAIAIERKRVQDVAQAELEKTELLLEAARALSDRTDMEGMLRALADVILSSARHSRVTISLWDAERRELDAAVSVGTQAVPRVTLASEQLFAPTRQLIAERKTIVADLDALRESERGTNTGSMARMVLMVPLMSGERLLGILALDEPGERAEFTAREIQVMEAIASQVAVAVENAQLFETQRRIAVTLQQQFIHPLPQIDGLVLAVEAETAYSPELIGGDFHDVFELPGGTVAVLLGDVEGKGVRAAGLSETVRSAVRALSVVSASPSEILSHVNRMLLRQESEQFVTALLLFIDPFGGGTLAASAGHPPAVHLRADDTQPIDVDFGPPLGTFDWEYGETGFLLRPGDALLAYTDGVSEARRDGELFGPDRIIAVARGLNGGQPAKIARAVRDAALEFGGRLRDDLQIVAIRFLGAAADMAGTDGHMRAAFGCDPQRLLETRHAVRDFLAARGVDEQTVEELVLCVEEACTNTLRHSGSREPGEVAVSIYEHFIEICVKDRGKGLDPARIDPAREPDLLAPGGRGLYIIRALADELELANEGGACVRIRKRLAPENRS
jgi:PAS domain S-box-containing protein